MCGIIGIVSRPSNRRVPEPSEILGHLDQAVASDGLAAAAAAARQCDGLLKGVPGARALIGRYELVAAITARLDQLDARVEETEGFIEVDGALDLDEQERDRSRADRPPRRDVGDPPRPSAHGTRGRGTGGTR